jgi:hypothetical protein
MKAPTCDSWQGAFKWVFMSSFLFLSQFGLTTLARTSATRIDFWQVERAKILYGSLSGGTGTIGLFNLLLPSIQNGRL